MFSAAYERASKFTFPVVISRRTLAGQCFSSVGSCVVVNKQGWFLTAAHILRKFVEMDREVTVTRDVLAQRAAIDADAKLDKKAKYQKRAALRPITTESNDRCSIFVPGHPAAKVKEIAFMDFVDAEFGDILDLAIGRLDPFDSNTVKEYPIIKNPNTGFLHATSLCKLGFPFHSFTPTYEENNDRFVLPPGALPMPRFPIEGLFTRNIDIEALNLNPPLGFPIRYVETSTPGLMGQSGGPTFDVHGRIWAIQAKTQHHSLGFDPPKPGGKKNEREHQFLNAGLGVHAETIIGMLTERGISFDVSAD